MTELEALVAVTATRAQAEAALAAAVSAQHELIRAARADRWPVVAIAQTAGLSRMTVHRVLTQADRD